jgi:hypothetical protein
LRADGAEPRFGERSEFVLIENDRSRRGTLEAGDAKSEGAFAGTGLANKSESGFGLQFQGDVAESRELQRIRLR